MIHPATTSNTYTVAPTIILGMHRSGTSMLTRALEDVGLFVGQRKDANHEAFFFLNLNRWLLSTAGACWDNPSAFHYLTRNDEAVRLSADYLQQMLASPYTLSYLGTKALSSLGNINRLSIPWGWKDPRNTFTLPIWLKLFPDAKLINVNRHGVDVANSLVRRSEQSLARSAKRQAMLRPFHYFYRRPHGFADTLRCNTMADGFDLWVEYMAQIEHLHELYPGRILDICYEDYLNNPLSTLGTMATHCGLNPTEEVLIRAAGNANPERAYSYRKHLDLVDFAESQKDQLDRFGY
jgi:hypothetical protein